MKFAIQHKTIGSCSVGHIRTTFEGNSIPFITLTDHSIRYAAAIAGESSSLDLGIVLSHLIARHTEDTISGHNSGTPLADIPLDPCTIGGCINTTTTLVAIETLWPKVLHIVPETNGETSEAFAQRSNGPLSLPIQFEISSHSTHTKKPPGHIRYRMVGRQLYHPHSKHFTAELLLQDTTYSYDDLRNHGRLQWAGDETVITTPNINTTFVVYNRISPEYV